MARTYPEVKVDGRGGHVTGSGAVVTATITADVATTACIYKPGLVRGHVLNESGGQVVMAAFGLSSPTSELRWAAYFALVSVVVPWLVLVLVGAGRPYDLGCRRPNQIGWRVLVVGYVVSVPFLLWMALGSDFAEYYLPQLRRAGTGAFLVYYFVAMLSEHFFFHGVLLKPLQKRQRH